MVTMDFETALTQILLLSDGKYRLRGDDYKVGTALRLMESCASGYLLSSSAIRWST
jgi:hypothetical protein